MYPSYLIHFNRQHDPKTGKFTYGDGDGDGVHNDHKNQNKSSLDTSARRADRYTVRNNRNRTMMTASSEKYRDAIRPALTREGTGKLVRAGDTKVGNYVNRNFTRGGTGKLVRVGDINAGSKLLLDQSNREKTTYRQALTRDGGTGKLVRVGDTKVPNLVKGDRRENPNGDKPGRQSDGTKSKDTYTKLPGQPISRVKNTYEKVPDGVRKPTYEKEWTSSKDEKTSTDEKYNTYRLNNVGNLVGDAVSSSEDENKDRRKKKPTSNSEKVSAEEKGRKFVLKTIERLLNKPI